MALRFQDMVLTDEPHGVNAPVDMVLTHEPLVANTIAVSAPFSNAPKRKRKRKAVKARSADRHAPGYMAAYMRKRRLSAKPQHASNINGLAEVTR